MDAASSGVLQGPTSFRLLRIAQNAYELPLKTFEQTHDSHPDLGHLCLLVFEAVLEVVCVSLPGYIIARLGHFDAEKQKFLANLNVMLFTPCLIFTKLASQLSAEKLTDLAIIPAIFILQTFVSWMVTFVITKLFRLNRRASNFVTAMGVFGNSNSLPISLVMSLSQTIKGLHWDRIPGDNDDEVGARGILYLLIFQQLGQLVRWSWGYHVLLAPKNKYPEYEQQIAEEGQYRDEPEQILVEGLESETDNERENDHDHDHETDSNDSRVYEPAGRTPIASRSRASLSHSDSDREDFPPKAKLSKAPTALSGNHPVLNGHQTSTSKASPRNPNEGGATRARPTRAPSFPVRLHRTLSTKTEAIKQTTSEKAARVYERLPRPIQKVCDVLQKCNAFLWEFMNPPLWAMLIAVLVASIPALQRLFFQERSFVKNSVTSAIRSNGDVAVPLILVVLGANLARNTMSKDEDEFDLDPEEEKIGTKLLVASLLSRMVLPTAIMAPILALLAKYLTISILDDPIFVIVCFLLTGAPSALQLAQICQINNVFEKTMGRILFQSYVIWILPSTLILVLMALEVVEWAK